MQITANGMSRSPPKSRSLTYPQPSRATVAAACADANANAATCTDVPTTATAVIVTKAFIASCAATNTMHVRVTASRRGSRSSTRIPRTTDAAVAAGARASRDSG